jgi:hypothetical protein
MVVQDVILGRHTLPAPCPPSNTALALRTSASKVASVTLATRASVARRAGAASWRGAGEDMQPLARLDQVRPDADVRAAIASSTLACDGGAGEGSAFGRR